MPTISITGTITTPSGTPVEGVLVQLTPAPPTEGAAEAIGGVGIITTPDTVSTAVDGTFSIGAQSGFRYNLTIEAIGFSRDFVAPTVDVRFDLLGLVPVLETVADYVDKGQDPGTEDDDTDKVEITIRADAVETVRERFEEIVLENADAQAGPWVEVDAFELEAGVVEYKTLQDAPNTKWWRVRYRNVTTGDEGQNGPPKSGDSDESELLISVEYLKEVYLFGVDLTDDEGRPYPDRLFKAYIEAAIGWAEKELDIPLVSRLFKDELHDHYANDYGRWGYFQLRNYPITIPEGTDIGIAFDPDTNPSPVKVAFQYPSQNSRVEIQDEWVVTVDDAQSGVIQIVPGQGNIADVLLIPGQLMPLWSGATGRVPGVWRFTYCAGFLPGQLPPDIKHLVSMAAAIGPLNIAGDLIAGAGLANISISVPGLSQSIGTTSSATNSGYGARILEYQKEIKQMLPGLKRYYGKGTKLVVA